MKKNILIFGLASGLILAAYIFSINLISKTFHGHLDNVVAGYTAMIIAFSFIYVGTRNFRDKYNQGIVSFVQAFLIGLGISLIGSTLYVGAWLIQYYCFMPDFMEKYSAAMILKAQHSGLTPEA
jgi:putative flippase GtrA